MNRGIIHHDHGWTCYRFAKLIEKMDDDCPIDREHSAIVNPLSVAPDDVS
jgi:hypothetical protein